MPRPCYSTFEKAGRRSCCRARSATRRAVLSTVPSERLGFELHARRAAFLMHTIRRARRPAAIEVLLGSYLFIYVWSVPMLMFDLVPAWGRGMGAFLLILQGLVVGLWLLREAGTRGLLAAAGILALSYLVELVGVTSGLPFGRYAYTPVLGLQLGGAVPLAIPFAWLTVVPGASMVAARAGRPAVSIPLAAMLALLLDLLIEPVAAYVTGYWQWLEGGPYFGVPTANFVAWGLTALVLVLLLHRCAPELWHVASTGKIPRLLFVLNTIQFTLVDAAHGFWAAALVGSGLLAIIWLLSGRSLPARRLAGETGG